MKSKILIVNGPNLNLLGLREPTIYGQKTLAQLEAEWQKHSQQRGFELKKIQSNHEGELIDFIQQEGLTAFGLIINGGAYSHTSLALADCLKAFNFIKIEVHISNIFKREGYRHHSYLAEVCEATLCGMGGYGYLAAIDYLAHTQENKNL